MWPRTTAGELITQLIALLKTPFLLAGGGVQRVHVGIAAAGIHHAIDHGGRRLKPHLIVNQLVFAAVEAPLLLARQRIDRVKIAVPTTEVKRAGIVCGRGMDYVAGGEFPAQFAGCGIQRVHVVIAAAKVNGAVCDHGAGEEHVEGIGDGLRFRLKSVDALGLEAPLAAGREFPARTAAFGIERVELAIVADDVHEATRDCRAARHGTSGRELPLLHSGGGIDRIHVVVVAAEVDHSRRQDRRRRHAAASQKFPLDAVELARCGAVVHAGVRCISAEHRLTEAGSGNRKSDENRSHDRSPHFAARCNTRPASMGPCS